MARKGIPQQLIRAIQSLYVENKILIKTGKPRTAPRVGLTNWGVRQGCPLSPSLFKLYIDDGIQNWQMCLPEHFMIGHSEIDTLLFADDDDNYNKNNYFHLQV